jgi:hypothetical protein
MLSRGEEVNLEAFARTAGHLRRMWESLGLERKQLDVTTLGQLIKRDQEEQRRAAASERDRDRQTTEAAT